MNRKLLLITMIIVTTTIVVLLIILSFTHKYSNLIISQDKWDEITNSRSYSNNLILQEIEFNGYKLIIDDSDTIYYSVVNDSQNRYNPEISYIASNSNSKIAILNGEITNEKIKSDFRFKIILYNDFEYHVYSLKCTDLPIMSIDTKGNIEDKQKNIPMELYLFNNLEHTPNRITISDGKLKIENYYYEFSLNMMTPGKNRRENKISILNMPPHSEYILTKVKNDIDEENNYFLEDNQRPKKNRVVLLINNEYQGIYSLAHKKRDLVVQDE